MFNATDSVKSHLLVSTVNIYAYFETVASAHTPATYAATSNPDQLLEIKVLVGKRCWDMYKIYTGAKVKRHFKYARKYELSAGSENWAQHPKSIKPALTDHLPSQTKSAKPILAPNTT